MLFKSITSIAAALLLFTAASAQTCIPTVTAQNGLAVNIHPLDSDGDGTTDMIGAQIHLSDLLLAARNNCDAKPLRFGLRKAGQGVGMPQDTILTFDCTELGQQQVEVWVRNAQGRVNYVQTVVSIQDNSGECGGNPAALSTHCSPDVLAAEIVVRSNVVTSLRVEGTNPPSVTLPVLSFVKSVRDNCGGAFEYRIRKAGQGVGVPVETALTFDCSERGATFVEIWVGDAAGNWAFTQSIAWILISTAGVCDNAPAPVAIGCNPDETMPFLAVTGLSQPIAWPEGGKRTRVYASDFVIIANDACSATLDVRISKSGANQTPPPPGQTSLIFTCTELGQQNVDIWLIDAAGNWIKVTTYVRIEDTLSSC